MTTDIVIVRTNSSDVCLVSYGDAPAVHRHQDIVTAFVQQGKGHLAALLALPRIVENVIEWTAPGGTTYTPLTALHGEDRTGAQGRIIASLAEFEELLAIPGGTELLSSILTVPSLEHVMVGSDGRIVLVNWGCLSKGGSDSMGERATSFRSTFGSFTDFTFGGDNVTFDFAPPPGPSTPQATAPEMALFSDADEGTAMDIGRACAMLGLSANPSREAVETTYRNKREEIEARISKIPVEALKAKYRHSIKELEVARDLLLDDDSSAATALNATKMFDLPGASPLQTAFLPATQGGVPGGAIAIGDTLSQRYQIRRRLGAGGMGMVFAAYDGNREREIAIKVLQMGLLNSREAQDRFLAEAKFSSDLSHPNIVNVFDVQRENFLTYLTMELLEGRTLRQEMEDRRAMKRPFALDEVRRVATAIGDALTYAHHISVHRDIKPENIWYGDGGGGTIKLMDFGIARLLGTSSRHTAAVPMGTAYYMAPEQMSSARDVDHRADQYSLAVVLYEMLVGSLPAGRIKPVREVRPDVPARMSRAIDRALEADRELRFPDIAAFLEGLAGKSNLMITLAANMVPATIAPISRGGRPSSGFNPMIAAAVLGVLVIGGVVMVVAGDKVSDMVASLSHDSDTAAKAMTEHKKAALLVERWEFVSRALNNLTPPEAVSAAIARYKSGVGLMERKQDTKAVTEFIAARESLSLEMQKIEDTQRSEALFQLGAVQGLRKRFDDLSPQMERERQEARSELKQLERASGTSKMQGEKSELDGQLARARLDLEMKDSIHEHMSSNVLSSQEYVAVQGRFAVADSLLKDQRFTEAKVELLAMSKTLAELRGNFDSSRNLLEAKYSAKKAKAALDATSSGEIAGAGEQYARATGFVRRGETLASQSDIKGAVAAYGDAANIYEGLASRAVQAAYERRQAESARRAAAEVQQRNAASFKQQQAEDQRLNLEREKMMQTQRMQEQQMKAQEQQMKAQMDAQQRQLQAQREMQERQAQAQRDAAVMQGLGSLLGGMGRR